MKDIKAEMEQKSIHNMKLPSERPFIDKYAGRSPERILCLYFVRLVFSNFLHIFDNILRTTAWIILKFGV